MNLIVAITIVVGLSPEEGELLLEKVVGRQGGLLWGCPGENDLRCFRINVSTAGNCLKKILPQIFSVLLENDIDLTLVSFDPFLTLFSSRMPLHGIVRAWDFCITCHRNVLRGEGVPAPCVMACFFAHLLCFMGPLSQNYTGGVLVAAYNRRLSSLNDEDVQFWMETSKNILAEIVKQNAM
jgi:hypothetical protein